MAGFDNDVVFADNVDFSGGATVSGKVTADGELLIGSTASPNIGVSTLTAGTGITITNASSSITIDATGSTPLSFPTDSGTATPAANALTIAGGEAIDTSAAGAVVTVTAETATATNLGVMTGDENDFLLTAGDLTLASRVRHRVNVIGGWVENLGFTLSSGTFSVTGADGTALSSTNPGYVAMQSITSGQTKLYKITADQSFDDATAGGGSDIVDNLFGTTTTVAWANDRPFYVYVLINDSEDTPIFAISDVPHIKLSPAAANIGAPDDAVADAQADMWAFSNIDETLYDGNPTLCVGSFRMTKDGSDDWTVFLDEADGLGRYQEGRFLSLPVNQFGASASTYLIPNGGTAPTFSTLEYRYQITPEGFVTVNCNLRNDGGTDGAGAVQAKLVLPYEVQNYSLSNDLFNGSVWLVNSVGDGVEVLYNVLEEGTYLSRLTGTDGTSINNGAFTNGARYILGSMSYYAFRGQN